MPLIETLTIKLGAALMKTTAQIWLKNVPVLGGVTGTLIDTLTERINDFETRRSTERLFSNLQDEVARRLSVVIEAEYGGLPENEREAAVLAVANVFDKLSLSKSLVESDLDATRIEQAVEPLTVEPFGLLGQNTRSLAAVLLRESCNYVVTLADKMPDFQVEATREILKRTNVLLADLGKVLDALADLRIEAADAGSRETRDFDLQYRRTLVRRLDRLELFGLRIVGAGAREYGLTIAFVTLTAMVEGARESNRVDQALSAVQRAIIRGEAGSGKTTLLQWLAVRAASRDFPDALAAWNDRLPLYIRLRDFVKRNLPTPEEYLLSTAKNLMGTMPAGWVHGHLNDRALVMVDGIDELPASRRADAHEWLRSLVEDFPEAIVIVSSRPAALDAVQPIHLAKSLDELGFARTLLEPMTLSDSSALVAQWHAAVGMDLSSDDQRQKLECYERSMRNALRERAPIRNLASSPLLCAMVCALNWDREEHLPDDRMELYRLALYLLLEQRDIKRRVESMLTREEAEELLDPVAYWMLRNGLSEAPRTDVEDVIKHTLPRLPRISLTPEAVLQQLLERSGVVREPQSGTIDFIHRTFLEYMAARAAVAVRDFGVLAAKAAEESWRETIVFAAGHAKGVARDDFVTSLLKKPIFRRMPMEAAVTAACCLETVGRALSPEVLKRLKENTKSLFPPKDFATAKLLAPAAAMMPDWLKGHENAGVEAVIACIRTAAIVGSPAMLDVIADYAALEGERIDLEIARAWTVFDHEPFAERVVRRRSVLFGVPVGELDTEAALCLVFLVTLGQDRGGASAIRAQLDEFRTSRSLTIGQAGFDREEYEETRNEVAWAQAKRKRSGERETRSNVHRFDPEQLVGLRSLRTLQLGHAEPEVIPFVAKLKGLEELQIRLTSPANLELFGNLENLSVLQLDGRGVRDLQPITRCKKLQALHLTGVDAPIEDWLSELDQLRDLDLNYPKREVRIPFAKLQSLKSVWFQGLDGRSERGLNQVPNLEHIVLSDPGKNPEPFTVASVPLSVTDLTIFYRENVDFGQVGNLACLFKLHCGQCGRVTRASHLLECRSLKYVSFERCESVEISSAEIDMLRNRGVTVIIEV